ncbi:hypothetical protein [Bradyrhizobium stylosanthis]|uniref:hypothetical protein n=1 Tax=Bradyrhizobium stylosanthis TaxID=1803665 RepID=UPI0012E82524|nr:hypothetical protein [Bradyrhizobium stylosanthis]
MTEPWRSVVPLAGNWLGAQPIGLAAFFVHMIADTNKDTNRMTCGSRRQKIDTGKGMADPVPVSQIAPTAFSA